MKQLEKLFEMSFLVMEAFDLISYFDLSKNALMRCWDLVLMEDDYRTLVDRLVVVLIVVDIRRESVSWEMKFWSFVMQF